jgi:O-antigen/teichoic acid export membrane protein
MTGLSTPMNADIALRNAKRFFWIWLVASLLSGVLISPHSSIYTGISALIVVVWMVIPFAWVYYDSRARGIHLGRWFKIGIAALSLVFVPAYVYQTRGLGKGSLIMSVFLLQLIGTYLVIALIFVALIGIGLLPKPS